MYRLNIFSLHSKFTLFFLIIKFNRLRCKKMTFSKFFISFKIHTIKFGHISTIMDVNIRIYSQFIDIFASIK